MKMPTFWVAILVLAALLVDVPALLALAISALVAVLEAGLDVLALAEDDSLVEAVVGGGRRS